MKEKGLIGTNPLLKQAEEVVEAKLAPETLVAYHKIVVSGMKLALDGGAEGSMLAQLKDSKNPLGDAVSGAIGIVGMLNKQAKNTMPEAAIAPAISTLIFHALDFLDRTGTMKIGNTELDTAMKDFGNKYLDARGVTKDVLAGMGKRVHGIMQDPEKMKQLRAAHAKGVPTGVSAPAPVATAAAAAPPGPLPPTGGV